jgi:PAS domain S-box-containing protein
MSAQSQDISEASRTGPVATLEEASRLRRTMRDLVALSTLPAVWSGLAPEAIARSLSEALLSTLSLDLVYVRLAAQARPGVIEIAHSKGRDTAREYAAKGALRAMLEAGRGELPPTIPELRGPGTLNVAVIHFGIGADQGTLIACSARVDFPSEQDRLLLGVAANQAAIVFQRRQVEEQMHEQREWLQVTLASIADAVIATDTAGRMTFLNPAAQQLTGWRAEDAEGRPLAKVFCVIDEETREPLECPVGKVQRDGGVVSHANHSVLIAKNGTERAIDGSAAPIRDSTGQMIGVVLAFRAVAEQRRREQHRSVRLAVTQALNQAATLESAASGVLRAICEELTWDVGLFWLTNEAGDRLQCRAFWHGQDEKLQQFTLASCDHAFAGGEGLPGRVWLDRKAAWIAPLAQDNNFPRLAIVRELGLQSAFACPVIVGDRTLGVIEFFKRSSREPDADLLELMGTVASNLGQFIERKATEDELRRSEQELAEFFENATVGLHWVGPDGRILRANRAELAMLGYTREEYIGRSISEFHADQDVICDILKRLGAGEKLAEYPARLRCKDGSTKDVLIDSSVMWNQGEFIHTRCFTRDITERRRAELALADARSRLDAALEAGAIVTWIWDIRDNRMYADNKLAQLFTLPPSDAVGGLLDNYVKAIHPDDVDNTLATLNRAVETGEPYQADYRIVQADGAIRWVTARGVVERDEQGRPVRMPGVLVDITERKTLEEELRIRVEQLAEADRRRETLLASLQESEGKLRLLADTIPQLAWMAQPDGSIVWYNQKWYEYTGTTADEMQGWGWQSVHDPSVLPHVLKRWKQSLATGEPFEMVFPLRGANGQFCPFLTRVNPLRNHQGRIVYWFGTNTDISEIKRMEEALREADRRKDEFLATLAHELRNPLAPIRNSLEILKMPRLDPGVVEKTRAMMERQVHHLVRLVDDLLDVSRVMRGKIELRKEPVELSTLVARAVETAQPLIELQGHRLDLSLPHESLLVDVDPVRMTQVIGNLLTNAAKYTEANGHIWVSAQRVEGEVVLRVRDNGIGIAQDLLPHVFELFVQADHTSTKAQGGLGIGLTLARNLTQMHGGTLEARSPGLGRGSEFIVRLPHLQQSLPCTEVGSDTSQGLRSEGSAGYRVLVVDDNKDAATSLAMLLRLQGHEAQVAHDGLTALAMAASYRPKVILLDIGMPEMDGYEVARRLRQEPGCQSIVLAALTGWGQKEDRRRTAEAGFDHHLVKPPDAKALSDLLSCV